MTDTVTVPRANLARRTGPPVRRRAGALLLNAALVLAGLLMVAPLVWLVAQSLTPADKAFSLPPGWLPSPLTFDNFAAVPGLIPFGRMAFNSLLIAVLTTAGALLTSILAAYAFSRLEFRGRDGIFITMLSALMVPVQLTVIPVFILMRWLHLIDTPTAVWLPGIINVFGIFFLRQYFSTIPRDLDEAARMDGAGHLWILFRMIVPLSGPAISALAIFVFESSWNNFFWPLIFLNSPQRMTLPVGLVALQSSQGGGPAVVVFAAVTLVVLPILVLFLIFQRAFIASIATTGLRA